MLGFMLTPQMGQTAPTDAWWAADNGRFAAPEKYTDESYFSWLRSQNKKHCIFATAPDVLHDHEATIKMSLPVFAGIRAAGYRPAFVAQDGWRYHDTPWEQFNVLFVGGSTEFKLGRGLIAAKMGRQLGKWVHMGRVNSLRRLRAARQAGCHSADGTFLKFAPKANIPRMLHWFKELQK